MIYYSNFARTIGAKDKTRRKQRLIRNLAIGTEVGVLGIGGGLALVRSRSKKKY